MPHLNIKDDRVHARVGELARRRGISATRAVAAAVEEALEREPRERTREEIEAMIERGMEISRRAAAKVPPGLTSKELMDSIYDDDGLPI